MKITLQIHILILSFIFISVASKAQVSASYSGVKTAYIYRFTEHIDWPNEQKQKTFTIGVYDKDKVMLDKIELLAKNKKIKGKSTSVFFIKKLSELSEKNLNILYVGENFNSEIGEIHT